MTFKEISKYLPSGKNASPGGSQERKGKSGDEYRKSVKARVSAKGSIRVDPSEYLRAMQAHGAND